MGFFSDLIGGGQSDAADRASDLAMRSYRDLAPYRELGADAAEQLRGIYLTGEQDFRESPGYQFRKSEAERGLNSMLAARGLLGSGAAIRGTNRLLQDLATQEYDRGFNRLASLAGMGQVAQSPSQSALMGAGSAGLQGAAARQSGYQDLTNTLAGLAGFAFG